MDMITCLTHLHFQHWFSWNIILMGSTIVLQLSVSAFLTVIFLLQFLSQKKNLDYCCINDHKKMKWFVTRCYSANSLFTKYTKSVIQKWKFITCISQYEDYLKYISKINVTIKSTYLYIKFFENIFLLISGVQGIILVFMDIFYNNSFHSFRNSLVCWQNVV